MANWDKLTVTSNNEWFICDLVGGGIPGLWFREAHKDPSDPCKCYLAVKNGIGWNEKFQEMTKDNDLQIDCRVCFEGERFMYEHHVGFKAGEFTYKGVDVLYAWELKPSYSQVLNDDGSPTLSRNGNTLYELVHEPKLSDEERDIVESWCREVDNVESQALVIVENGGNGDITFPDYTILKWFEFGDKHYLIRKSYNTLAVDEVVCKEEYIPKAEDMFI